MSEDIAKVIEATNYHRTLNLKEFTFNILKSIYVYDREDDDGHVYTVKIFEAINVPRDSIFEAELLIEKEIEEFKKGLER